MEDRRCSGCTLSSLTLASSPSLCSPVLVRCSRGGGGGFGCSLVGLHSFAAVCQTNQFWPPRLHVVWLLLFKWTSRLQTGHKWLRLIQTLIIEIPCKRLGRFKYVVSIFFHVSGEFFSFSFFFLFTPVCRAASPGHSQDYSSYTFLKMLMSLRLKITMQILLSGPSSGDQGLSYQHILHLWTYALLPAPPAKCSPPLLQPPANILCIWTVNCGPPPL